MKIGKYFSSFLWRFIRASVALALAGAVAYSKKDPKYLALAPAIQAIVKYLRAKFGLQNIPL